MLWAYSLIAPEFMAAILVERTTMMKNYFGILPRFLFKTCTTFSIVLAPTWLPYQVSAI